MSRREIHGGRVVNLSMDTVRFPDGSSGELELIRHPGASAVLPFLEDPRADDPEVLLIRQYRYASGGEMIEVPAGIPDSPEEPWLDCARRELEEETGYAAGQIRYLTEIFTTPGFTNEVIRLYVAWDLRPGTVARDADEFIEPERHRLSAVLEMVRDGRIVDAKSIATILYASAFFRGSALEL